MSTIDKAEEQALGGHHKFGTTLRHASVEERLEAGKAARATVPRSSHAAALCCRGMWRAEPSRARYGAAEPIIGTGR